MDLRLAATIYVLAAFPSVTLSQEVQLPRFQIDSREDLIQAVGVYDHSEESLVRMAMVAREGRRVLPWIMDVIQDTTVHILRRKAAVAVLGFTRDTVAVDVLLNLVETRSLVWIQAREALRTYVSPRVCAFWRTTLRESPGMTASVQDAIVGVGVCGDETDAEYLRDMLRHATGDVERMMIHRSLERLSRNGPDRHRSYVHDGPPHEDGAYVPTEPIAEMIRAIACAGPCLRLLLPPNAPLRRRVPGRQP